MKNKIILLSSIALLFFAFAKAQKGARVAYIDMEYILENVPEYQAASQQLDKKMQRWKNEIDGMKREIDQMKSSLQNERVLLTNELIEEKEEDIQLKQEDLSKYQQKRFGASQGDFILQKQQLIQPVQDQVFNEIQKIGAQRKYDYVVDSSDLAMLYSAERHDISDQVLRAIGRTGKKNDRIKSNKKGAEKPAEDEPYLSVIEAEKKEEKVKAREKVMNDRELSRLEKTRVRDSIKDARRAIQKAKREALLRRKDSIKSAREAQRAEQQREREAARNKKTPPGGE